MASPLQSMLIFAPFPADMLKRQELGTLREDELIDLYYYIYNS